MVKGSWESFRFGNAFCQEKRRCEGGMISTETASVSKFRRSAINSSKSLGNGLGNRLSGLRSKGHTYQDGRKIWYKRWLVGGS